MMMKSHFSIVTKNTVPVREFTDETSLLKCSEGPVDSVPRQGRHFVAQHLIDLIRRRVNALFCDGPVYRDPGRRQTETCPGQRLPYARLSFFMRIRKPHHNKLLSLTS